MMKKNSINPLKALALFALVLGLGLFTGCSDDEDDAEPAPTLNLLATMEADAELSVITELIKADAELKAYLEGSAEYTVFAPTNAAMDKLKATLQIDDFSAIAPSVIDAVLRFHFVSGSKLQADLANGGATTVQGEKITLEASGNVAEAGSDADGSAFEEADIKATNGVVHKMETVLIPEPLFATIGINLGTLAQPVLLSSSFTGVASIVATADSDVPSGETSISAILADKTKAYTCFLPADQILDAIAASKSVTRAELIASVSGTPAAARAFILNHISSDAKLTGADLTANTVIKMMTGTTVVVAETDKTEQTPLGLVLANTQDQSKVTALFQLDAYSYTPEGSTALGSAINGSLHVSSIVE